MLPSWTQVHGWERAMSFEHLTLALMLTWLVLHGVHLQMLRVLGLS